MASPSGLDPQPLRFDAPASASIPTAGHNHNHAMNNIHKKTHRSQAAWSISSIKAVPSIFQSFPVFPVFPVFPLPKPPTFLDFPLFPVNFLTSADNQRAARATFIGCGLESERARWHRDGMAEGMARDVAARILQKRERGEDFVENIAEKELAAAALSGQDRSLAVELAYGCVRREGTLDFLIDRKTEGRTQKAGLRILLRLGLYQLFFLDRVPEHAAVHETVELAKRLGFAPQSGFVNAVLREYVRRRAETKTLLNDLEKTKPWIALSHPEWLWKRWSERWGPDQALAQMRLNNESPAVFARLNTLKGTHDELTALWQAEGVEFVGRQFDWAPLVFELKGHPPLGSLASFKKGLFYLQDASALLAPKELGAQAGESILDLCAAPGGKTTFVAQLTSNQATIVAEDVQPARLALVRENAERLGAKIEIGNAAPDRKFDRILIDAPCSNTGVLRRRVDLRWRLQEKEIPRLATIQLGLIDQASRRLKPRGTILYSTCSVEPDENQAVVRKFIESHPDFRIDFERELIPYRDGVDGAFVARIVRA